MTAARIILAVLAWLMLALPQAATAKRVALIIANSSYTAVPALKNPVADARLVTGALKQAGFASIDVRLDLDKAAMEAALRDFSRKADGADVALIYYAGHGIEAGGQNYLIPADARLVQDRDLDIEATRLDTVLAIGDGARMRIVILDACRNNPFTASMQRTIRRRAIGRGLAAIEPEGETLVVYAAKAGAFAEDGLGNNSPFAIALAKRLPQPGLEIGLLFRAVRDDVLSATDQVQEPFTYGSLSGTAFYFVPPSGKAAVGTPRPSAAEAARARETLLWQGALNANTSGAYQEYLRAYPRGSYAEIARQNLSRIAQAAVPARPMTSPFPSQQPGFVLPKPELPTGIGKRPGDYDIGNVMSRPIRLGALATAPPASDGDTTRGQFYYIPQGRIRIDLKQAFLDKLRESGPAMAADLVPKFEARDPFAEIDDTLEADGHGDRHQSRA
jgi:uncharacterized caspase-like protein